jgi:hypothetical protein
MRSPRIGPALVERHHQDEFVTRNGDDLGARAQ